MNLNTRRRDAGRQGNCCFGDDEIINLEPNESDFNDGINKNALKNVLNLH